MPQISQRTSAVSSVSYKLLILIGMPHLAFPSPKQSTKRHDTKENNLFDTLFSGDLPYASTPTTLRLPLGKGCNFMSFFDDAISTIGRGLAQTAAQSVSDATGFDVGGTLNVLFGNGQTVGAETLSQLAQDIPSSNLSQADIAVLEKSVDQQTQMINDLGLQISSVGADISSIKATISDLESKIAKINQEQTYQEWQTVETALTPFIEQINISYKVYGEYIANAVGMKTTDVSDLINNILDANVGPRDASATINGYLLDSSGGRGALQLWSNMISGLVAVGQLDYRDAVARYMNYYKKLAYAQLQATNLLMEAYTFQGNTPEVQNVWSEYRGYLQVQEAVFIRWLTPLIAAAIAGGYYRSQGVSYWGFGAIDAINQLNPSLQALPANPPGTLHPAVFGYYQPSPVFRKAEELLASLYVTETTDRRVVVHMMYQGDPAIMGAVGNVTLHLTPVSGADPVSPSHNPSSPDQTTILPGLAIGSGPDLNYYDNIICMKRIVFENSSEQGVLNDDTYTVQNINGIPPTVNIETYYSGSLDLQPPQFIDAGPLNYEMAINEQTPFAFMNFLTYVMPQAFASMGN
ncbi:hypothetical protein [Pseudomonas sp. 6D_7.1_Bac1]|uniref:hypothetical protein n=1 Tax=Pseudomonas sp. 6D_7.1_Bac1 TaxID=2971615 RepID=UPI0021C84E52|nr:hypothetical protein [Pseudomonas sp. 6D_7.1_Bac1]MCU1748893.1 hypothetical protein [Pseudomonas sp. 6D_7.1_Bac1]